ncbi:MAG TPA: hypothetical protein VLA60_16650 [Nitrospirales bacterium]|nr:hypothetical protein [Nitrospirales bacterium]
MNLAKSQLAFIRNHCETPVFVPLVNRSGIPLADGLQGIQEEIGYEIPVVIPTASELCYTAGIKKCRSSASIPKASLPYSLSS